MKIVSKTFLSVALLSLSTFIGTPAFAQDDTSCDDGVREEIARILAEASRQGADHVAKIEEELYEKYSFCIEDSNADWVKPFYETAKQCGARVSYLSRLWYEEMPCCGYDSQRRTFACPVKIKRKTGFGASPLPGSREYVYHCVQEPSGAWRPVGHDSVHLSNSRYEPTWQFAVVANANNNLHLVQPMNGEPRNARSILSWNFRPTSCDYKPLWGNVIDYQIRLDQ